MGIQNWFASFAARRSLPVDAASGDTYTAAIYAGQMLGSFPIALLKVSIEPAPKAEKPTEKRKSNEG
jgi:hypothetical protein